MSFQRIKKVMENSEMGKTILVFPSALEFKGVYEMLMVKILF